MSQEIIKTILRNDIVKSGSLVSRCGNFSIDWWNSYPKLAPRNLRKVRHRSLQVLEVCADLEQVETADVALFICSNRQVKDINQAIRQKDETTDVLSLEYPKFGNAVYGDLILNVEMALEASNSKMTIETEITVQLTHGICHIFGHEHENSEEEKQTMQSREQSILQVLTKGAVGLLNRNQ